jgi:hypothetical protein
MTQVTSQKLSLAKGASADLEHYSHSDKSVNNYNYHDQVPSAMPSRDASPIPNHATDHYDNLLLVMKSFVCEGSQSYRLQHWAISFHHASHKETQFWESLSERAMALGCTVVEDTLLIPTWM